MIKLDINKIREFFNQMSIEEVAEYYESYNQYSRVVYDKENDLVILVTHGWSDNEEFIHNLLMYTKHSNNYLCTWSGGSTYFTTNENNDYEVIKKVE